MEVAKTSQQISFYSKKKRNREGRRNEKKNLTKKGTCKLFNKMQLNEEKTLNGRLFIHLLCASFCLKVQFLFINCQNSLVFTRHCYT